MVMCASRSAFLLTRAIYVLTFFKFQPFISKATQIEKATGQETAESHESYIDECVWNYIPFRYSDSCTNNVESQGAGSILNTDTTELQHQRESV